MELFALDATREFGQRMALALGIELSPHEERAFEDGEHKSRPLTGVRGRDAYVVQSLHGGPLESVNDKLVKLLFFAQALRDARAARVTAVIPYLAYARKDRRTKPRDPLASRYMAQLLESSGVDTVVSLEVHNVSAYENALRIEAVHLDTCSIFAGHVRGLDWDGPVVVASPDTGGVKRAQLFREHLERALGRPTGFAFMEKRRSGGVLSGSLVIGEVRDALVLVLDDLIASGSTMARAARAFREQGAARVEAMAAHGLFTAGAAEALADEALSRVVVTDTVPPFRLDEASRARLEVVSAAPLMAEAVKRLHGGGSITGLQCL